MRKNRKLIKKITNDLYASWFGIFDFEALNCDARNLVDEFYDCDINNPVIRKLAIEKIALPYFNRLDNPNQTGFKQTLVEALTFTNEELRDTFDSAGLVFKQSIQDPYAFLVDVWNIVFPNEEQ